MIDPATLSSEALNEAVMRALGWEPRENCASVVWWHDASDRPHAALNFGGTRDEQWRSFGEVYDQLVNGECCGVYLYPDELHIVFPDDREEVIEKHRSDKAPAALAVACLRAHNAQRTDAES